MRWQDGDLDLIVGNCGWWPTVGLFDNNGAGAFTALPASRLDGELSNPPGGNVSVGPYGIGGMTEHPKYSCQTTLVFAECVRKI